MTGKIPTQIGDVLILTTEAGTIRAVGAIHKDDQQDFSGQISPSYVSGRAAAEAQAKALVTPGRRIYLRNKDTGDWSEIPN